MIQLLQTGHRRIGGSTQTMAIHGENHGLQNLGMIIWIGYIILMKDGAKDTEKERKVNMEVVFAKEDTETAKGDFCFLPPKETSCSTD